MAHEFHVDKAKTESHWLELTGNLEGCDPAEAWRRVSVKWDGCIHFNALANVPENCRTSKEDGHADCYIHICDIDEMIADLQEIKRRAQEHFGPQWPNL